MSRLLRRFLSSMKSLDAETESKPIIIIIIIRKHPYTHKSETCGSILSLSSYRPIAAINMIHAQKHWNCSSLGRQRPITQLSVTGKACAHILQGTPGTVDNWKPTATIVWLHSGALYGERNSWHASAKVWQRLIQLYPRTFLQQESRWYHLRYRAPPAGHSGARVESRVFEAL